MIIKYYAYMYTYMYVTHYHSLILKTNKIISWYQRITICMGNQPTKQLSVSAAIVLWETWIAKYIYGSKYT